MKTSSTDAVPTVRRSWARRFFCWKTLLTFLLTLAGLVALVVLLVALDGWRGNRAWKACKAEREARGEILDWKKLIPPPITDEKNFAATPLLREIYTVDAANRAARKAGSTNWSEARISRVRDDLGPEFSKSLPLRGVIEMNRRCDLATWAAFFTGNTNYPQNASLAPTEHAKIILTALGKFDAEFEELQQAAATRPLARFDVDYNTDMPFAILLPHITELHFANRVLSLRAMARLADGQSDAALADWKLSMRFGDAIRNEMFLISHLVRITKLNESLLVVQEGLARHAWSEGQLKEIERVLSEINMLAEFNAAMRSERAGALGAMEYLKHMTQDTKSMFDAFDIPSVLRFSPNGWVSYNQVALCDWFDRFTFPSCDEKARRIYPAMNAAFEKEIARIKESLPLHVLELRREILVVMLMPALNNALSHSARTQTVVDHARIACAMERFRNASGNKQAAYPETLDALVPEFLVALPHDPVGGQPYHYRREGADGYVLYGIGMNEKDDGGTADLVDRRKGDWVWRWPPH